MDKGRLEAFSDGVIAIIITIMVLEMKVPQGTSATDLLPMFPIWMSYLLSFVYVGIYWNNHHHLLHTAGRVNGLIMWANLHLLFWLSLMPFATAWMGKNRLAPMPTALYGGVLLMAAIAYALLQAAIIRAQGSESVLARAVGRDGKGKWSPVVYAVGIGLAWVWPDVAQGLYVLVALMWIVPDLRIERALKAD